MYDRRFVVPSVGNSSLFTVWNLKNKMFSLINRIDINHFTPKWKHPYGLCLQLIWLSQPPRVHQAGYKKEKEKKRKKKDTGTFGIGNFSSVSRHCSIRIILTDTHYSSAFPTTIATHFFFYNLLITNSATNVFKKPFWQSDKVNFNRPEWISSVSAQLPCAWVSYDSPLTAFFQYRIDSF